MMMNNRDPQPSDQEIKHLFIDAFFDDLESRAHLWNELLERGFPNEAMLLCCCFIDGLASALYWPDPRSQMNFVRAFKEYSEDQVFKMVHTRHFVATLEGSESRGDRELGGKVCAVLANDRELRSEEEVLDLLSLELTAAERARLTNRLWKGTIASIAYDEIRSHLVHGLGAAQRPTFEQSTLEGEEVPPVTFEMFYRVYVRLFEVAKERSLATNKWFGHDFRP